MQTKRCKNFLTFAMILAMFFVTACSGNPEKNAQSNTQTGMQETKKPGGTVTVYGWSGDWDLWFKNWGAVFEKETGIKVQYVSGDGLAMMSRVVAEKDKPRADLLLSSASYLYQLKNMGLLEKVPWDKVVNAADVDSRFKDDSVAIFGYDVYHLAYNPKKLKAEEVPKTWSDLANPKWKGRILLRDPGSDLTAWVWMALADQYGKDKAFQITREMFGNAKSYASSAGQLVQALAAGEVDVAPASIGHIMLAVKQAGGNVSSAMPDRPILMLNGLGIIKNSPNPEGAVKFLDFFLGTYVQEFIMNKAGTSIAVNSTVKLTNEDLVKIGLGGIAIPDVLKIAYLPDWNYWSELQGDKTRLAILSAEIADQVKSSD